MKAIYYDSFLSQPRIENLPDPEPSADGIVLKVEASGICRSDWHGWQGHDPDIVLPHVPGHEMAGTIVAVGDQVKNWQVGARVTLPFICACGICRHCLKNDHQVCTDQFQPGFTHWGSFAEFAAIHRADLNLVALPNSISSEIAASLGCRFATSFRAVTQQARISAGQWIAIHGCGGVGLSAVMIAAACGARVIAVDISEKALKLAKIVGAEICIDARTELPVEAILEFTKGGADASIDALGSAQTMENSINCLRPRGRHIQVGLMPGPLSISPIPLPNIIGNELEIIGSHGMSATHYPEMISWIEEGRLQPSKLIGSRCSLEQAIDVLINMDHTDSQGLNIITSFTSS